MTPLDDIILESFLRTDSNGIILQKEDGKIEFKAKFDRDSKESRAKYVKELAALHNYEGGYLFFGIDDKTRELRGLENFDDLDNAILADDIKSYFSPHFHIESKAVKTQGKLAFVIYVPGRENIPTVCIRDHEKVLNEATIYWRYSGQAAPIKAGDLIHLLHSLRGEEVRELVSVKKTELKQQYKPVLTHNGVSSGMDHVKMVLESSAALAKINELNVLKGEVNARTFAPLPRVIRKGESLALQVTTKDKSVANSKEFSLQIKFEDDLGTKYEMVGNFKGAQGRFGEAKEIG